MGAEDDLGYLCGTEGHRGPRVLSRSRPGREAAAWGAQCDAAPPRGKAPAVPRRVGHASLSAGAPAVPTPGRGAPHHGLQAAAIPPPHPDPKPLCGRRCRVKARFPALTRCRRPSTQSGLRGGDPPPATRQPRHGMHPLRARGPAGPRGAPGGAAPAAVHLSGCPHPPVVIHRFRAPRPHLPGGDMLERLGDPGVGGAASSPRLGGVHRPASPSESRQCLTGWGSGPGRLRRRCAIRFAHPGPESHPAQDRHGRRGRGQTKATPRLGWACRSTRPGPSSTGDAWRSTRPGPPAPQGMPGAPPGQAPARTGTGHGATRSGGKDLTAGPVPGCCLALHGPPRPPACAGSARAKGTGEEAPRRALSRVVLGVPNGPSPGQDGPLTVLAGTPNLTGPTL
ncbi:hypothetical protein SAMN05421810_103732 [Amycolatopsis arida]|uniref:Uncharacterized protein n=1 Tax=Amycolatopsis arida TaxID=587909 RepID=A0A1I5TZD6_9PSEU|nr:hypothetical protein CLV69_10325 [Amycolatopsis arida]SFP88430.1 hypothetical protein SAMN05421810_103732 [Amycolatopsis arida]